MLLLFLCLLAVVGQSYAGELDEFDWNSIKPSWDLEYTPCYGELQCARLLLPLDWLNPKDTTRTVAIAIAKLPAKVDASDEAFGGTVITNPGGPGDSGVVHMVRNGHFLQDMVDDKRYYEVLSFDPRGMFHSTPAANCYQNAVETKLAQWQQQGFGLLDFSSEKQVRRRMAQATAFGQRCARADAEQSHIREHMSTASVARDMLAMVDKLEASRRGTDNDDSQSRLELRSTTPDAAEARIQYFGTSYGTILGNTFLSMFPGRVHRMVLDGLVVAEEWVNGDESGSLSDTTNVVNYFYKSCFEAESKCALWEASDDSWKTIKARVNKLIEQLDATPQPVSIAVGGPESVITGADIRMAALDPLYDPLDFFEVLATLLQDATQGNYTRLLERIGLSSTVDVCSPSSSLDYSWQGHANIAVICGDRKDQSTHDYSYWKSLVQRYRKLSPEVGDLWAEAGFSCSGWQARPKYRFDGPFTSPKANKSIQRGQPSAPLLLLSSLHDPVTPLRSARIVAKGHPGSRVLVQKSVGHCAFLSAPSECTKGYIRQYMETGILPPKGTECEPDCVPWKECSVPRARLPR